MIKIWFRNARPRALPQSVTPAVLAVCIASRQPEFVWWLGVSAVIGVAIAHLAMNLFDDYFDYRVKRSEYRIDMMHRGFRARLRKCHYLLSGEATLGNLLTACCIFAALAVMIGCIILYFRGINIVWIALAAAFLGLEYSGPPFRLSYRGLGEAVIGVMFGPLSMAGVYYASCGLLAPDMLFLSVPVGLLVANIVYTHSIMDYEPDREVGKMTFAVLLGSKRAMSVVLFILIFTVYSMIITSVVLGYISYYYLITLLTLPHAIELYRLMSWFVREPSRQFTPKWWYGPTGDYSKLQTAQIDWFMVRWLLARNLLMFFCLALIAGTIIS